MGRARRPRSLATDGAFYWRLAERMGRDWPGPLTAVDYGGRLIAWMGAVIRLRQEAGESPGPATTWGGSGRSISR
ncbi:hypothetical protein ACFRIC_39955 [Streptomyces sp. NPDC056738]|uniref:hypothetical protein n=1 Tax=Streptomyces sp. NPDC056738 TaxID=3345933 RepID=UPI0036B430AB